MSTRFCSKTGHQPLQLRVRFGMPVLIMPVTSSQIGPDLVVVLGVLNNRHIDISHSHTFGGAPEACQRANVWYTNLGETSIAFPRWSAGVCEYYCYDR